MNEDYSPEVEVDFSRMSRDELYEIINSSAGVYGQRLIDGAKNELLRRELEGEPVDSDRQVTGGEVRPPMPTMPMPSVPNEEGYTPAPPEIVPDGRLYSDWQVATATWLGSPAAGCLLLARNYEVLENKRAAWQTLLAGAAGTVLLFAIIYVLPEDLPGARGIPIGLGFGMHQVAKQLQGAAVEEHLKAGGGKGTWTVTVLVGFVAAIIILVLIFAAYMTFGSE